MQAEPTHAIYIGNVGLVLLGPYLPVLFERLRLLGHGDAPRIDGFEARSRAVHLLQYLADGRCDAPEPELALNKLLIGAAIADPVAPGIEPTAAEIEICDGLLHAVIANWPVIKSSSVQGLRETFLQRDGRLRQSDARWDLHVQRKAVDVLVDQIPWAFSTIFHRWMPEPLHVSW